MPQQECYMGMRITIRKPDGSAVLITFRTQTEKLTPYEKSKFFRGLYGWNQCVPSASKQYEYRRKGVLDEVPHIKVADSVFVVAHDNMETVMDYFEKWADKVQTEMMEVMLGAKKMRMLDGD